MLVRSGLTDDQSSPSPHIGNIYWLKLYHFFLNYQGLTLFLKRLPKRKKLTLVGTQVFHINWWGENNIFCSIQNLEEMPHQEMPITNPLQNHRVILASNHSFNMNSLEKTKKLLSFPILKRPSKAGDLAPFLSRRVLQI